MQLRTILAAVSGGSAAPGVLEVACRLARQFGSHLEGMHVRLDPRDMAVTAAEGFGTPISLDIIDSVTRDAAETAARARKLFDAALTRHGLVTREEPPPVGGDPGLLREASACWHEEMGYSPTRIAGRARLFDLMVFGRSGRVVDEPSSGAIEEALLTSRRPVLIAPAEAPKTLGETIAVAWNASAEAASALAASMPLLAKAREVYVLSLGETGAAEVVRHLGWYGVRATARPAFPVEGAGIGGLLLSAARDSGADLLVMGGYGRSPWRELLFGGATREVVGTSLLPLLLAH